MSEQPRVLYRPVDGAFEDQHHKHQRYAVLFDGDIVGYIESFTDVVDRPLSRQSTVSISRGYVKRWSGGAKPGGGLSQMNRTTRGSRWEAAMDVICHVTGLNWTKVHDMAKAGRVERKTDTVNS